MKVLGIESSCDETAAAVVEDGGVLLSNAVSSQMDDFVAYGGVIPEIAARSHIEAILPVVEKALDDADCTWGDIDAIGATYGPGLIGSLLVGTLTARTLALTKNIPFYPIHHVEAHVYANFVVEEKGRKHLALPSTQPAFPMLALIVSGGHSQLVLFRGHGDYTLLGQTQDDAIGEAFDKVAKIIGLPYPGGVSISKLAPSGDARAFTFPKANLACPPGCTHNPNRSVTQEDIDAGRVVHGGRGHLFLRDRCHRYDFSFSGLKTAVLRTVQAEVGVGHDFPSHQLPERVSDALRADIAASFQRIAVETLVDKTLLAFQDYSPASVVIAGGVAANLELRRSLQERLPIDIEYAPMSLCTDNAVMIAALAYYQAQQLPPTDPRDVEVAPSLRMEKWSKLER